MVLEAFNRIRNKLPDLQLVTVGGNGWDYAKVKEQVNALGLKIEFIFLEVC